MMADVFISYSHIDSKVADEICQLLDSEGISYFRDEKDIDWGNSINLEVRSTLEKTSAILVIISPASLKSYWVPYEIGYAIAFRKKILPYLTHPSLDVPGFISDLKYITSIGQVQEYFRSKFIDEKTNIQSPPILLEGTEQLSRLEKAYKLMPNLLQEMKNDLLSDKTGLVREFRVLRDEHIMFHSTKHRFVYYENQHEDLLNKIGLLEEFGFIIDITTGNLPIYRMVNEFIDLLISTNLIKSE
jgi:hypothetical protein